MDIKGLLGSLNLGLIIAKATDDDFVHLTVEDVKELILVLQEVMANE